MRDVLRSVAAAEEDEEEDASSLRKEMAEEEEAGASPVLALLLRVGSSSRSCSLCGAAGCCRGPEAEALFECWCWSSSS